MAKSHHDKIAIVSGGANGIGQAFAQRLAQDGAHIVIADIAPGSNTVKMVEQAGRQALACTCDVSSVDSVKALASDVAKHFDRCDILINCAGIFPNQPFEEMAFADWRRVLAINLDSVFLMSAAFVPGMKQRQWGAPLTLLSKIPISYPANTAWRSKHEISEGRHRLHRPCEGRARHLGCTARGF